MSSKEPTFYHELWPPSALEAMMMMTIMERSQEKYYLFQFVEFWPPFAHLMFVAYFFYNGKMKIHIVLGPPQIPVLS
jgi:hypothetical protein